MIVYLDTILRKDNTNYNVDLTVEYDTYMNGDDLDGYGGQLLAHFEIVEWSILADPFKRKGSITYNKKIQEALYDKLEQEILEFIRDELDTIME